MTKGCIRYAKAIRFQFKGDNSSLQQPHLETSWLGGEMTIRGEKVQFG